MDELAQLRRENDLLRELVKAKDETIQALKAAAQPATFVPLPCPAQPPVSIPSAWRYPSDPQPPYIVTCDSTGPEYTVGACEIVGIFNAATNELQVASAGVH